MTVWIKHFAACIVTVFVFKWAYMLLTVFAAWVDFSVFGCVYLQANASL